MDLTAQLRDALAGAPGAHPELITPTLEAVLAYRLPRELEMNHPEKTDALLRHLSGGRSWVPELLKLSNNAMAFDWLVSLGFRDAALADFETFCAKNDIPAARILRVRLGTDAPDALLEVSGRATGDRVRHAARCAAIASGLVTAGVEDALDLLHVSDIPLRQAALRKLGPERAGAVMLRAMRKYDQEQYRIQALMPVLETFGVPLPDATIDAIGERVEAIRAERYETSGWFGIGDCLANSGNIAECVAFIRARLPKAEGWRQAMRGLLGRAVQQHGFVLDPSLDEFIDPAQAAKSEGYDVWKVVTALLRSIPLERAEPLLMNAAYADPGNVFRFPLAGLSQASLEKLAVVHAAKRDDKGAKDFLIATSLKVYGPAFGEAVKLALADVKPKATYLKALERNLDPAAWASVKQWLDERPEPKKKTAPKKKKVE